MDNKLIETIKRTIKELKADAKRNPNKSGAINFCIDYLQKILSSAK